MKIINYKFQRGDRVIVKNVNAGQRGSAGLVFYSPMKNFIGNTYVVLTANCLRKIDPYGNESFACFYDLVTQEMAQKIRNCVSTYDVYGSTDDVSHYWFDEDWLEFETAPVTVNINETEILNLIR